MSSANVVSLVIFLWLVGVWGVLRFMRAAHPYREEDSEEQKREDEEQARALSRWQRNRRRK